MIKVIELGEQLGEMLDGDNENIPILIGEIIVYAIKGYMDDSKYEDLLIYARHNMVRISNETDMSLVDVESLFQHLLDNFLIHIIPSFNIDDHEDLNIVKSKCAKAGRFLFIGTDK